MNKMERIQIHAPRHITESHAPRRHERRKKKKRREGTPVGKETVKKWMHRDWNTLNPEQKREVRKYTNEKIRTLTGEMVRYYEKFGIRLAKNGRIDTRQYETRENLPEIRRHKEKIAEVERLMRKEREQSFGPNGWETEFFSELSEILIPIVLTRHAPRLITVRSNKYDDYCGNKIDNVIIDRKTGDIVCAIDELTVSGETNSIDETAQSRWSAEKKKYEEIIRLNVDNPNLPALTYSFKKTEGGKFTPHLGRDTSPVCMIPVERDEILRLIGMMGDSLKEKPSQSEKEMFRSIISRIYEFLRKIVQENLERVQNDVEQCTPEEKQYLRKIIGVMRMLKPLHLEHIKQKKMREQNDNNRHY